MRFDRLARGRTRQHTLARNAVPWVRESMRPRATSVRLLRGNGSVILGVGVTPRDDHLNALRGHAVLAITAIMGAQYAQAVTRLEAAERHAQAIGDQNGLAMILDDLRVGATLYGASQALREQISTPNWDEGPLPPAQTETLLIGTLGAEVFEELRDHGRAMDASAALHWARRTVIHPA